MALVSSSGVLPTCIDSTAYSPAPTADCQLKITNNTILQYKLTNNLIFKYNSIKLTSDWQIQADDSVIKELERNPMSKKFVK